MRRQECEKRSFQRSSSSSRESRVNTLRIHKYKRWKTWVRGCGWARGYTSSPGNVGVGGLRVSTNESRASHCTAQFSVLTIAPTCINDTSTRSLSLSLPSLYCNLVRAGENGTPGGREGPKSSSQPGWTDLSLEYRNCDAFSPNERKAYRVWPIPGTDPFFAVHLHHVSVSLLIEKRYIFLNPFFFCRTRKHLFHFRDFFFISGEDNVDHAGNIVGGHYNKPAITRHHYLRQRLKTQLLNIYHFIDGFYDRSEFSRLSPRLHSVIPFSTLSPHGKPFQSAPDGSDCFRPWWYSSAYP